MFFIVLQFLLFSIVTYSQFDPGFSCGTPDPLPDVAEFPLEGQICQPSNQWNNGATHLGDFLTEPSNDRLKIRTNVIIVQNSNGKGNFEVDNADDVLFLDRFFERINNSLNDYDDVDCECTRSPTHYPASNFEFVPNYIYLKDDFYFNHLNDSENSLTSLSDGKIFTNGIHDLAVASGDYIPGIDLYITTDGPMYESYVDNNSAISIYDLGYVLHYANNVWYASGFSPSIGSAPPAYAEAWHAPDLYLRYKNELEQNGESVAFWHFLPRAAASGLHEYGHVLGLAHKYNCTSANYMKPGWTNEGTTLTGCQNRVMYARLMSSRLGEYVICGEKDIQPITIDSDVTLYWADEIRWFGDIIIEEGTHVEIKCELRMNENASILVKRGGRLTIDGALITTNDCSTQWEGIIVEGKADEAQNVDLISDNDWSATAGVVEVINGAVIENAETAISTEITHYPYPTNQEYWGGYIRVEDSYISNCNRGIAFMKYGGPNVYDHSTIKNSTFENLGKGVTIWSDNGVRFLGNHFNNIEEVAITGVDTEFSMSGNIVEHTHTGVDLLNTFPLPISPRIGSVAPAAPNEFNCDNYGIYGVAPGAMNSVNITNNNFLGGNYGIDINGFSRYEIRGNDFIGEVTGVRSAGTGGFESDIAENNFSSIRYGSEAWFFNALSYDVNCFDFNDDYDVYVGGQISQDQGNEQFSAGNCFSGTVSEEFRNDGGIDINYFIKEGTQQSDCRFTEDAVNFNVAFADEDRLTDGCGSSLSGGTVWVRNICNTEGLTQQQIQDRIDELNILLTQVIVNESLTDFTREYLIRTYRRCMIRLWLSLGNFFQSTDNPPDAVRKEEVINAYMGSGEFQYQILAYGILVYYDEYNRARNLLANMSPQTTEEQEFVWVQNINLDYLQTRENYLLSPTDEATLTAIALKSDPYSGYARALYEQITGIRIYLDIPSPARNTAPRESASISIDDGLEMIIKSNPILNDNISLKLNGVSEENQYQLDVVDITGELMWSTSNQQKSTQNINTQNWNRGIYIVRITNERTGVSNNTKIVVMK